MPWMETAPMKERMRFVTDWERELYSMVELCERYGISRKTGYKWIERCEREGPDGPLRGTPPAAPTDHRPRQLPRRDPAYGVAQVESRR
jgi:putative transposase